MCFIIEKGQEKPYIAYKDIRCYKVMTFSRGELRSLFFGALYEQGVTYRRPFQIKLSRPRHSGDLINVGYHSYRSKVKAKRCCPVRGVVVRCIIPKGTLFFKSSDEYVSNGIKIEGIVH